MIKCSKVGMTMKLNEVGTHFIITSLKKEFIFISIFIYNGYNIFISFSSPSNNMYICIHVRIHLLAILY